MTAPEERTSGPDDTAAFERFYNAEAAPERQGGLLYRLLIGWWRDKA